MVKTWSGCCGSARPVRGDRSGLFLLLGIAGGLAGGLALAKKMAGPREASGLAVWQRALAQTHGVVEAGFLCGQVQNRFEKLSTSRPRFASPALRMHLEEHILPGLALYEVLCEELGGSEAALRQVDRLLEAQFLAGLVQVQARLLERMPDPFPVMRRYLNASLPRLYPSEAWTFEHVENSNQVIAFNASRCFYLDVLTAYGAPELTPSFCRLDDVMMERFPFFAWKRSTTLARGGPCCDFRFERIDTRQARHSGLELGEVVLDE